MTEFTVYTDGSHHQGIGGWAWLAVDPAGLLVDGGHGAERETTNNRMELQACIEALSSAPPNVSINLVTDSAYVSNCFLERWYDGWRRNGWVNSKKKPVENRELWEELIALVEARRGPLRWTHVRGHGKRSSDDPTHVRWNAEVDRIAGEARLELVGAEARAFSPGPLASLEADLRELERTDRSYLGAKAALDDTIDRLTHREDYVMPENLAPDPDETVTILVTALPAPRPIHPVMEQQLLEAMRLALDELFRKRDVAGEDAAADALEAIRPLLVSADQNSRASALALAADELRSRFPDRDVTGRYDGYDAASGWLEAADYIDPRVDNDA
jgi:ribonuclease HI